MKGIEINLFTLKVSGEEGTLITKLAHWQAGDGDAPSINVWLPAEHQLSVEIDFELGFGQFQVDGDLALDRDKSSDTKKILTWSANASESENGSANITIRHALSKFDEVEINIELCALDDAEIEVEEEDWEESTTSNVDNARVETVSKYSSETNFLRRYGNYAVGCLGAFVTILAAAVMPTSYQSDLIVAAMFMAWFTWTWTEKNEEFGERLLGMLFAGGCLFGAYLMPAQADTLVGAAGFVAFVSLAFF